ncbi:MAG: hypothetical protein HZB55_19185 [Deltaproteobacteria bacterium]|nr:hypothetical protein [Deltaproteobacteria bacterium]
MGKPIPSKFVVQLQKIFGARPTKPGFVMQLQDIVFVNIKKRTDLLRFEIGIEDGSYRTWLYNNAIKGYQLAMKDLLTEWAVRKDMDLLVSTKQKDPWAVVIQYARERIEFLNYLNEVGYISYK